jgi:hypothetical protein
MDHNFSDILLMPQISDNIVNDTLCETEWRQSNETKISAV